MKIRVGENKTQRPEPNQVQKWRLMGVTEKTGQCVRSVADLIKWKFSFSSHVNSMLKMPIFNGHFTESNQPCSPRISPHPNIYQHFLCIYIYIYRNTAIHIHTATHTYVHTYPHIFTLICALTSTHLYTNMPIQLATNNHILRVGNELGDTHIT